ncbi:MULTISPECIES: response regulator [unclassified Phaeobacter]|uniref:response regulator n=1 Tax=unclassified Phaeobacter TaxID=2621772 RepID=UPI003A86FD9C
MKNVLIVEDVAETREWLRQIVKTAFPAVICDVTGSLRQAKPLIARSSHDLCILDLKLPDGSGLSLLPQIRERSAAAVSVVATVSGDDASIVSALTAGADGYLLKEQPSEILVRQLRQISIGIPALSPVIAQRLIKHFRNTGPSQSDVDLSKREAEVLALIGRGLRNAEVASELGISIETVSGYIKTIYRKLGISSRAEAGWHAKQMGLW